MNWFLVAVVWYVAFIVGLRFSKLWNTIGVKVLKLTATCIVFTGLAFTYVSPFTHPSHACLGLLLTCLGSTILLGVDP